jgi:hypothetical protein
MSGFKFFRDPSQRNRDEPRDPFKSEDWTDYGSPDDERPIKYSAPPPQLLPDPFTGKPITQADIDAQVDSYGEAPAPAALPAAPAAAAAPAPAAPAQERTLQQKSLINPERQRQEALRKAKEEADGKKAEATKGRGAGQGLTTGGLSTYGNLSGSGGFGKQTKLNPARR